MADKNKVEKLREDWSVIFNILKTAAPALFGTKIYTDVEYIGQDPDDPASKLIIQFKEEPA